MRILVTRPEPDGARTAQALRERGHEVCLAPVLIVEPVAARWGAGPWAGVLITSANAARAVASHPQAAGLLGLPVLAVGASSAIAARAAGFENVESAGGDGGDLAALAAARHGGAGARLLYLAGEDRARDLGGELSAMGMTVETVPVYRAVAADRFPPLVRAALEKGTIDGVTHFSRRSAAAYLRCVAELGRAGLAPAHFCLSEQAAGPLRDANAPKIFVAEWPDEAALVVLVGGSA